MKIAYKHLLNLLFTKPSINDLSEKMLQLGHEHEIEDEIFDMEFTPNRGDCLSLVGLARDLNVFYKNNLDLNKYKHDIPYLDIDFINNSNGKCSEISFLYVEIDGEVSKYKDYLENYFLDLGLNKINFFTDISNYIGYEMGQPTHCYDFDKINGPITLEESTLGSKFQTLKSKNIDLDGKDLVFLNQGHVINLAGIMGGSNSSCSDKTKKVLIECAYFKPESIIGRALKYDLHSDASHKFERGVDPNCQEDVLRRFIHILNEHSNITELAIYNNRTEEHPDIKLEIDLKKINQILGMDISINNYLNPLQKLGFYINKNITVPSYRNDIAHQNDLAEEVARVIGYDNIPVKEINIPINKDQSNINVEDSIKSVLIDNGFYEVINPPFVSTSDGQPGVNAIKVDNPLDSNRQYLRTDITNSLVQNLLFNERRQQDSIKLFEISDIYFSSEGNQKQRRLGVIASGRVGKNYRDFSQKIDINHLLSIFEEIGIKHTLECKIISREGLDTKLKSPIISLEINLDDIENEITEYVPKSKKPNEWNQYSPISEFPLTSRDISYSVKESSSIQILNDSILKYENDILKDKFAFDYYVNEDTKDIKIGYRFIFQAIDRTLNDLEVDIVMNDIISFSNKIKSVDIPGLKIS